MVLKTDSTDLSEEQKKALDELKEKNQELIEQAEHLSQEYELTFSAFDKDMKKFWGLMRRMEKANSRYPFGHYTNYYYKNLEEPISESFILDNDNKNPNFLPLNNEEKDSIGRQLPDYEMYSKAITEKMQFIKKIILDAISSNIIIIRIANIFIKYRELEKLNENWWCPQEIAQEEYGLKGSFASYDPQLTIQLPYHREIMIKFDTLYYTASGLQSKLEKVKKILKTINSFLPFAELLPSGKTPQAVVHVEATANNDSVKIENGVKFNGDAVIGKDAKLKKE